MNYYCYHIIVKNDDAVEIKNKLIQEFKKDIVAIDADRIICDKQVFAAIKRANFARIHKRMMAKAWGLEVMVQITGLHQISEAMRILNVRPDTRRILIITENEDLRSDNIKIGFPNVEINSELIEMYQLNTKEYCKESIAKGVLMVNNNQ